MNGIEKRRFFIWITALAAPSVALVLAIAIASGTWERVRTNPDKRTIKVTGSAKQRIISDLIEWNAVISTKAGDRTASYRALHQQVAAAMEYLEKQGIPADDIRVSAVTSRELFRTEYIGSGAERVQKNVSTGWSTTKNISVRSKDIPTVERASRGITELLEQGVSVTSNPPSYLFTQLDPLKIEMLARASANARERAERIVNTGGSSALGALWDADMGVINVNPANSVATSWEGNYDRSSYEKDIIAVVHLTFQL